MENARKSAASKIFDAARDLFYRRGIRAVGVDEIVCEAGVTKPSLYRAFKSKDDLVAACLREDGREGRAIVLEALANAGTDPRTRLDAMLRHFVDKLHQPHFRGCLMSNVAVELPDPAHPGRQVLLEYKTGMREIVLDLTTDLPAKDPEILADSLILLIEGAIATYHVFGTDGPARSLLAACDAVIDAQLQPAYAD